MFGQWDKMCVIHIGDTLARANGYVTIEHLFILLFTFV